MSSRTSRTSRFAPTSANGRTGAEEAVRSPPNRPAIDRIDPRPGSAPRWRRICAGSGRAAEQRLELLRDARGVDHGSRRGRARSGLARARLTITKPAATTAIKTTSRIMP